MKHTKSMVYAPSAESRELELYAVNDGRLYRASIAPTITNLARKYEKGIFEREKAIDAFYPIATTAARMYCREFAAVEDAPRIFDVTARYTAAVNMLDYYMEDIEHGKNWDKPELWDDVKGARS